MLSGVTFGVCMYFSMSFFEQKKKMVIIMCSKKMQMLKAIIQLGFLSSCFSIFDIKKLAKINKLH